MDIRGLLGYEDILELDCSDGYAALKIMEPHLESVNSRVCDHTSINAPGGLEVSLL